MTTNRRIGTAVTLGCALVAAVGLISGYLAQPIAAGIAVIGIVIGAGVARGNFSRKQDATKKNQAAQWLKTGG